MHHLIFGLRSFSWNKCSMTFKEPKVSVLQANAQLVQKEVLDLELEVLEGSRF